MEEVIVEGLDYEDFVSLKLILTECTLFNTTQFQYLTDNNILLEKIEKILLCIQGHPHFYASRAIFFEQISSRLTCLLNKKIILQVVYLLFYSR